MIYDIKNVPRQNGNTRKLVNKFIDNLFSLKATAVKQYSYLLVKNQSLKKNILQRYASDIVIYNMLSDSIIVVGNMKFMEIHEKYFRGKYINTLFIDDCYEYNFQAHNFIDLSLAHSQNSFDIIAVGTMHEYDESIICEESEV